MRRTYVFLVHWDTALRKAVVILDELERREGE